jgi:hypothetical protein
MSNTLANVKYTSILPMGKTGDYAPNQKVQFEIPPECAYIDGRQSYIYMEVENTSTIKSMNGGANFDQPAPVILQPHLGANGLFRRVQLMSTSGVDIEDIDGYNTYSGLLNSYCHDSDQYEAMGLVEGVVGHSAHGKNRSAINPALNYFQPGPDTTTIGTAATGGNVAVTASFCAPLHLGSWSGLGDNDEKMAYPNLPIGGSILNLYLEDAKVCMAERSHAFYNNAADNCTTFNFINAGSSVDIDNASNVATSVTIKDTIQNYSPQNGQFEDLVAQFGEGNSCFKQGDKVDFVDSGGSFVVTKTIEQVKVDSSGDKLELVLDSALGTAITGGAVRCGAITPNYNIKKVELRVLETVPSNPQALRQALNNGINYKSILLNKLSQASALKNSILNIPSSLTKALSIFTCPVIQDHLETFTGSAGINSLAQPALENTTISYSWQYQIRNFLCPNRKVDIRDSYNNENDNSIHYQQLDMAFRPVKPVRCLADTSFGARQSSPLNNPVVVPLMLAPIGSSYKLLDSEPQLRYTSSDASATLAKLFHIYVNHVRVLKANPETGQVEVEI